MTDLFFELLQISFGRKSKLSRIPSYKEWNFIFELSQQQAVAGVMLQGLERLSDAQKPPIDILLQWIGTSQLIENQNKLLDKAIVALCKDLDSIGVRFLVMKGQTLAQLYPVKGIRQSGDIDFLVHREDIEKALLWLHSSAATDIKEEASEKHISFIINGIEHEMHRVLTIFNVRRHRRYFEKVVMPDVWKNVTMVSIDGFKVPTLSATYNALYVFVHLCLHLLNEGVGIRQFCNWMRVLEVNKDEIDKILLKQHLDMLGLYRAYTGLGALLTDYLGMSKEDFPFEIGEDEHKRAPELVNNVLELGNFGHNLQYSQPTGIIHGIQHLGRIIKQSWELGWYAPSESWGKIPSLFGWWRKKIWRVIKKTINRNSD